MRTFRHALTILIVSVALHSATAEAPGWWADRNVLTMVESDDFGVMNQGQLKNLMRGAIEELNAKLPPSTAGAGYDLNALLSQWRANPGDDYVAVNLGQLKAMGQMVRERLVFMGVSVATLGTATSDDDDDFALANLGQAKTVFSFEIGDYIGNLGGQSADPDDDGLTNAQELALGTSPVNPDTDGDGMPDGWEQQYSLNPCDPSDAGPDQGQVQLPGEPHFPDTSEYTTDDTFGGSYFDEFSYLEAIDRYWNEDLQVYADNYAAALRIDVDSDGLSNLREYTAGTNPRLTDTDGDGYSDYEEVKYGGNPLIVDIPPVRVVISQTGLSLLTVTTYRGNHLVGGETVTLSGDADTLLLLHGSSSEPTLGNLTVTTAENGTATLYVFVLGGARATSIAVGGGLTGQSSPIDSYQWLGTVFETLNPGAPVPPSPTPNSPPPPDNLIFTAYRVKSVTYSGRQTLSNPMEQVGDGGAETRWFKPGEASPPPYSDDGFNGDADLQGNNKDPGDPRDEISQSGGNPVEASPGDDKAYPVETNYGPSYKNTGPYNEPGAMVGNYEAKNAYNPPDKVPGGGSWFDYQMALSKLSDVNYSRGGNDNGWMGNGTLGVKSYSVYSTLGEATGSSTMTYTDVESGTEMESTGTYATQYAGMAQAEVRLQTNTRVVSAAAPISSDFLLIKTTQTEGEITSEYIASLRLSITQGLISDTCEVIAGTLPDGDVKLQNGVVSIRSPEPVSGKVISYTLGNAVKRIWSDIYPDSMANQLPNVVIDSKSCGSGLKGYDYIMVGATLDNVTYDEYGGIGFADNTVKIKVDIPNIPEKLVCTLAPRNSIDPKDFVLSTQTKDDDCISVECIFTESNGTPSGEDYEVVLVYDATSNGIDKSDKIVHRTKLFVKPVARRQFNRSDTILQAMQVSGYAFLPDAYAFLYAFRNGADPPNAPDKIESELIDVTDGSSGKMPDHNTGITFTGQYSGQIKKYTYGPTTMFAKTLVHTSVIEDEIRRVLDANKNSIELDKTSDSLWGSADQDSFKDYVFDLPILAEGIAFGFASLDPDDVDLANSIGRCSVLGAKIKARIHRTDPSRGTVYFIAGTVDDCYDFDYGNETGQVENWGSPNEHGANVQAGHGAISSTSGTIFRVHIDLTNVHTNVQPFYTPPPPITGGYP